MSETECLSTLIDAVDDYLLENMVDQLPGMVVRCLNNNQFDMLYISHGSLQITGYTPEELMAKEGPSLQSLIVIEEQGHVWQEVQASIKHQKPFEIIHRINTKNGEEKWVIGRGQAKYTAEYYDDPGNTLPELILEVFLFDITQQKQAELKLIESKKFQRSLLDGSIEGILIHRLWKPLYVNKSLLKMLGYDSYQEVISLSSVSALIAPHERERVIAYAKARLNGEFAPEYYEFEGLHRNGSFRCIEIKSSLIEWRGETAILSTIIDITQRKHAQRKAEQQRQRLFHANRLNMLSEITAGIAHELNQPLSAITTRCAAAKNRINSDNPDLEKIKEALSSIEEQALRSGEIIKQLRSLVKTQDNQFQEIDLNELLETCLRFIKLEGLFKTTDISTNISEHLPTVIADATQIQQVLLNLIRNASDAMKQLPKNERHLTITAIQHDDKAVQISVRDNGEGISAKQEENLFQSFYTTKDDGMGMGLSISHTIITAHKGLLWFSRNTDRGVTFRLTLPVSIEGKNS